MIRAPHPCSSFLKERTKNKKQKNKKAKSKKKKKKKKHKSNECEWVGEWVAFLHSLPSPTKIDRSINRSNDPSSTTVCPRTHTQTNTHIHTETSMSRLLSSTFLISSLVRGASLTFFLCLAPLHFFFCFFFFWSGKKLVKIVCPFIDAGSVSVSCTSIIF